MTVRSRGRLAPLTVVGIRRRRVASAAALLLVLVVGAPASAAPTAGPDGAAALLRRLAGSSATIAESATARTAALRAALSAGGFAPSVAGLLAAGAGIPGPPALPLGLAHDQVAAADGAVAEAIAGLDGAVRLAGVLVGEAPVEAVASQADAAAHSLAAWMRDPRTRRADRSPPAEPGDLPLPPAAAAAGGAGAPGRQTAGAAAVLAQALDTHLPDVSAAAAAMPRTGGPAQGCDVLDQLPHLCVGSTLDNTYTEDAALLVDLGGADTYLNAAGAAPILPAGSAFSLPVSLNLDLGPEADTYRFVARADRAFNLAQGAGAFGAVGMLVDSGGDDSYTATLADADAGGLVPGLMAQGAALGGIGLLFDLDGADIYEVTASDGPAGAFLAGQGAAHFCAASSAPGPLLVPGAGCPVAATIDRGQGNDRYLLDGGVAHQPAGRHLVGQGYGNFGVGVLFDDGGTDAIETHTRSVTTAPVPPAGGPALPDLRTFVQGTGLTGLGAVLTGRGDTRYVVDMDSEGRAFNRSWSQGVGILHGSVGVIDDAGGDDAYSMLIRLRDHRRLLVDDGCGCASARARVEGSPSAGVVYDIDAFALGLGYFEGVGYVHDHGSGDDVYVTDGEHDLRVALDDRLAAPQAPALLEVVSYGSPGLAAQGVSRADAAGWIADDGGTDVYTFKSLNRTEAEAASAHAAGPPAVDATSIGRRNVIGQGAADFGSGFGALLDLGGADDRITAVALNPVTTRPDPDGAYRVGSGWPIVQADGQGGHLVALGEDPVIVASPSAPTCAASPGPHGFGAWLTCPIATTDPEHEPADGNLLAHAGGLAPTAVGQVPQLTVVDTPAVAAEGQWIAAAASLRGPGGAAIAGAEVHFDVQVKYPPFLPVDLPGWSNRWEADGVTGPDGVARVRLPLELDGHFPYQPSSFPPGARVRVLATFDGSDDLHPRHAAQPVTLT